MLTSPAIEPTNPLHPLVSIGSAVILLTMGLLVVKVGYLFAYLGALALLLCPLGYGRSIVRSCRFVLPLGLAVGSVAYLLGDGVDGGLRALGRILLLAFSAVLASTVNPTSLSRCLNQVGCPKTIALGLLITARFISVLKREIERVREAMLVRGVEPRWYNLRQNWRALVVPLAVRLINISDTLALSIETRGFSLDSKGTVYQPVRLTTKDYLVGGALFALAAGAGFVSW